MIYSNYHTHTRFCDGENSPEELIVRALELGLKELGFSIHSDLYNDLDGYFSEISRLKEKYADKISIKNGVEYDYYFDIDTSRFDYVIGGVHYLEKNGKLRPIDYNEDLFLSLVNECYGGDFYALCEDYFKTLEKLYEKTHCDIVAHFDLVTKYNENDRLFDTKNPRYIKAAEHALLTLIEKPVIFEINTGAMAKGYRSTPYPAKNLLDILKGNGAKTILSSDCHDKRYLTHAFSEHQSLATLDKLPERN